MKLFSDIIPLKSGIEEEFNVEFPSAILYEYSTLDTIIASGEAGFGNSEYTEDDLKAIIDKMGI
jgi:hypothetical protein